MFTQKQLERIMPLAGERATIFYPLLVKHMFECEITTLDREAAFLATIAHESAELRYVKEIWGPTTAQMHYDMRHDLGNLIPGDGKRFMGRGLIEITGRDNYTWATKATGVDFVNNPELLEQPDNATRVSCLWWQNYGLNRLADIPDFTSVTRRVNGGLNGMSHRQAYYNTALRVLATPDFSNVQAGPETV